MLSATDLPLLLINIVAPLGAFDILYFHIWRFRLYEAPSSRAETVTHIVRGFAFGGAALLLTFTQPAGAWYWAFAAIVGVDFVNNIVDVSLEGESRAPLGGLPRSEYIVHIAGASFEGAIGVAFLLTAWPMQAMPTGLLAADRPAWLFWPSVMLSAGVIAVVLFELGLFVRSLARSGWQSALDAQSA